MGGTFSNVFGDLTLRGELGLSLSRFFSTSNPTDADGITESNELASVLGFDWYGIRETLVSLQIFQSWLTTAERGLLRDGVETNATFLLQREFLNDSLIARMIWLHSPNHGDGILRPRLTYELRDNLRLWAGMDVFYGSRNRIFGQFDRLDRITTGMEWGS